MKPRSRLSQHLDGMARMLLSCRVLAGLTMFGGLVFLVWAHQQVLTFTCGNDPMLYIRAARVLIQPDLYGHEAVRESLTFVAPGFPILLAVWIRLFGDLSPYYLNLCLLLLGLPLMWFIFNRTMHGARPAALAVIFWLVIVAAGHEQNLVYVLYPFRETSCWFIGLLAYAAFLCGTGARPRRSALVAGGILVLTACAIREPSVLILPGAILGVCLTGAKKGNRRTVVIWTLAPLLVVACIGGIVAFQLGILGSAQLSAAGYIFDHTVAAVRIKKMLYWFPAEMSWWGVALAMVGVIRSVRRAPLLLYWFVLPALLLFVFYAYMQMHTRYFLVSIFFLSPLVGYGLDALLEYLAARVVGETRQRLVAATCLAACLGLAAYSLANTIREARPWGAAVDAQAVRDWQQRVQALEPAANGRVYVAMEQRCRYLEDLLLSYTDAVLVAPKDFQDGQEPPAPLHYFRPLDRAAYYATPQWLDYLQVEAHNIMAYYMDLKPVEGAVDSPVELGGGHFEQCVATPWRSGFHEASFHASSAEDALLWFDFGRSDESADKKIELHAGTESVPAMSVVFSGNGIHALHIPANRLNAGRVKYTVHSTAPVPSNPVLAWTPLDQPLRFDMANQRRLSTNRMFPILSNRNTEMHPVALHTTFSLTFQPPPIHSDVNLQMYARFQCLTDWRHTLTMICTEETTGRVSARDLIPGNWRWSLPLPQTGTLQLQVANSQWPRAETRFLLNSVEFWAEMGNAVD